MSKDKQIHDILLNQTIKIRDLEEIAKEYENLKNEIHGILFSIGSPLNDNKYGYTKEQLRPFFEISKLIE